MMQICQNLTHYVLTQQVTILLYGNKRVNSFVFHHFLY